MLDRSQIAALIPHAGTMCLLDKVERWDATSIRCVTARHRNPENPLKRPEGGIGAVCVVEFAAQAMAVHGRLAANASGPPTPGVLASVRDLRLRRADLAEIAEDLVIDAVLLMGDERTATYGFTVNAAQDELGSGRATVVFDIAAF